MSGNSSLSVEQLTVNYEKTAVLWDINFSIPKGNLVGVIGPNGAGKSTLLKTVMGLIKPVSGSIDFFGLEAAYVPQRSSVDWDFPITAFDLVLMGLYGKMGLFKWVSKADRKAAYEALCLVEMEGFAHRQIGELSGGQQQRLFIARALLQNADLYLMDEPFSGIDIATEKTLINLFRTLRDQGKTVVVVHHDLSTVEAYFDSVVMLNTCLIAFGPVKEVFSDQTISRTYGRSPSLLDEAAKMLAGLK